MLPLRLRGRLCQHRLTLRDELHLGALRSQAFDAEPELLFPAAHRHRLKELSVGQIREPVTMSVYAHQTLSPTVIGRNIVIGNRPASEIQWAESQTVSGPTDRPASKGSDLAMTGTVAYRGKVLAQEVVPPEVRRPAISVVVGPMVSVVIDARA